MEHPENDAQYTGLTVNSGVAQPPIVNPYLTRRRRKPMPTAAEMVDGIVKGDVTMLSAVTLVESLQPEHYALAREVIDKCLPYSGNSRRIGITGVPGAGKSTSIDVFGLHVLRDGGKLAVLAIDPSSERTKGSILGDKTRMEKLAVHPSAFIRPSPSAGSLGGVARKTRETIVLCEAPDTTTSSSKPSVWAKARLPSTQWSTSSSSSRLPALATSSRASSVASWRWPTESSSTRPTATT